MADATPDADLRPLLDAVEWIAREFERVSGARSSFHLARCGGCDGPSFQQPCPHCRFYPIGDAAEQRARTAPLTAEGFRRNVERSAPDGRGNLATWHFASFRQSSAHKPHSAHAARVDALVARGAAMEGLPSPDEVFRAVTVGGSTLDRPPADPDVSALWRALFEARAALSQEDQAHEYAARRWQVEAVHGAPRTVREAVDRAAEAVTAAAHGDDGAWEPALDELDAAIGGMLRVCSDFPGRGSDWVPVANLRHARSGLREVRERRVPVTLPTP